METKEGSKYCINCTELEPKEVVPNEPSAGVSPPLQPQLATASGSAAPASGAPKKQKKLQQQIEASLSVSAPSKNASQSFARARTVLMAKMDLVSDRLEKSKHLGDIEQAARCLKTLAEAVNELDKK